MLVLITNRKSICTKIGDGPYFALFYRIHRKTITTCEAYLGFKIYV